MPVKFVVNLDFMAEFQKSAAPCFALGIVEIDDHPTPVLAIKTKQPLPADVLSGEFEFGHALHGTTDTMLLQFTFQFYGHSGYQTLLNPANPMVQSVISTLVTSGQSVVLISTPGKPNSLFRAGVDHENLAGMREVLAAMPSVTTTDGRYERQVRVFKRNEASSGTMLKWVCRDNLDYLDVQKNPYMMDPTGTVH